MKIGKLLEEDESWFIEARLVRRVFFRRVCGLGICVGVGYGDFLAFGIFFWLGIYKWFSVFFRFVFFFEDGGDDSFDFMIL